MLIYSKAYASEATPVPELRLFYEDADLVVVDRPTGVAAHTEPGWDGPAVTGASRAAGVRISVSGPVEHEGVMHHLDVRTSRATVTTKLGLACGKLKNTLRYHRVEKIYLAVAHGILKSSLGTIDAPIGRAPGRKLKMAMVVGGRPAAIYYDAAESLPGATLAQVQSGTGRIHQVWVHFAVIGRPLSGDTEYRAGTKQAVRLGLERQWLHASRLVFKYPRTGIEITMDLPLPPDLQGVLVVLRGS